MWLWPESGPELIEDLESRMPDNRPEAQDVLLTYDLMMGEQVFPALRELGFTGTARKFTMRRDGAYGVLAWQKDSRFYRHGLVSFTANMSWWCGSGRIGRLIPTRAVDTWWALRNGEPADPVAQSVLTAVRCFARPAILAGLDDPVPQPHDPRMHGSWDGGVPDGGGADPAAWFVQPAGTRYDHWFAQLTSDAPSPRLQAAYLAVAAEGDRRTLPALLDRLEQDPDPVVRKEIASRMLPRFGHDPQVRPALRRTATDDEHPGVRWAGRYALRVIETPDLDAVIAEATARR
jgi:hypothetical protein